MWNMTSSTLTGSKLHEQHRADSATEAPVRGFSEVTWRGGWYPVCPTQRLWHGLAYQAVPSPSSSIHEHVGTSISALWERPESSSHSRGAGLQGCSGCPTDQFNVNGVGSLKSPYFSARTQYLPNLVQNPSEF